MKVNYLWPKQCNEHTKLQAPFEKPLLRAHRFALGSPRLAWWGAVLGATTLNCVLFSSAVTSYSFRRRRRAPWVSLGNEESTFFSWSQLKERINQMWTNLQALLVCFSVPFSWPWHSAHCSPVTSVPGEGGGGGWEWGGGQWCQLWSSSLTLWALPVSFGCSHCLKSTPHSPQWVPRSLLTRSSWSCGVSCAVWHPGKYLESLKRHVLGHVYLWGVI